MATKHFAEITNLSDTEKVLFITVGDREIRPVSLKKDALVKLRRYLIDHDYTYQRTHFNPHGEFQIEYWTLDV